MDVIEKVDFLTNHEATGSDRLSTPFLGDAGELLTSKRTNFLGSMRRMEEVLKAWRGSAVVPIWEKGD